MRALLAVVVFAVAAGGTYAVLTIGCDVAPDFVLLRGACEQGVDESAVQIAAGAGAVIAVAYLLDARRRHRR